MREEAGQAPDEALGEAPGGEASGEAPDEGRTIYMGPYMGSRYWRAGRRRRFLFLRLLLTFGVLALLLLAGIAATISFLAGLFSPGSVPNGHFLVRTGLIWLFLALILPMIAVRVGRHTARGITRPLADLMAAADAVAAGDLNVRVGVQGPGEFGRLAQSFNHMTAELQRADQQRRNLTADVAHELRTPLHIIQGNLEGLLDGVYEPTPEHIQATLAETQALARLVDDLRTLSLAEAGQLPLAREPVDVRELLADVATSFSGQAEATGIDLRVEAGSDGEALTVTGDEGRLDQVLGNLMMNALRHTPGGGSITLSARAMPDRPVAAGWAAARPAAAQAADPAPDHSRGVRISVADTGEGIPAQDLPYIFDRFWRGDRARTRPAGAEGSGGSGLGLAIARQLVQAHGGSISVQSVPGQGTVFTIDLPAGEAAHDPAAHGPAAHAEGRQGAA